MRKLTRNQQAALDCLNNNFQPLLIIRVQYAKKQESFGYIGEESAYKSELSRVLDSLIKRDLVEYKYKGFYKLK